MDAKLGKDMVISEAPLAGRCKGLIWGIVGTSVMVLVVSALVSGIVLPGLLMAAAIVAFTWAILRMNVSIAIAEEKVVLRLPPFYSTEMSVSDVVSVSTAPDTSLADGYGFRLMGRNTRGLLVGGPAIALESKTRRWVVSTARPEEVTSAIRDQMTTK